MVHASSPALCAMPIPHNSLMMIWWFDDSEFDNFQYQAQNDLDQKPKPKLLQLEKALPYSILSLETPWMLVMVRCEEKEICIFLE